MKRLFLMLLTLMCCPIFSQNFLEDNKQWNVIIEAYGQNGVNQATDIFYISGDTIIDDNSYYKLYVSLDSLTNTVYHGALREEQNTIIYRNNSGDEGVLYDFSLEAGDTTYTITEFTYGNERIMVIVDSIEYVEIGGISRKKMWIHNDESWEAHDFWIEGLGSNNGPLHTFIHNYWVCPYWQLSCCFEDGVQIFQHDFLDCYVNTVGIGEVKDSEAKINPNPIKEGQNLFIELQNNELISGIEFKDLTGKSVARQNGTFNSEMNVLVPQLPKGVYMLLIHTNSSKVVTRKILIN
jgi:hypothetical protein